MISTVNYHINVSRKPCSLPFLISKLYTRRNALLFTFSITEFILHRCQTSKNERTHYIHENMSLFSETPQHVIFFISNNVCYESSRYENVSQGEKQKFQFKERDFREWKLRPFVISAKIVTICSREASVTYLIGRKKLGKKGRNFLPVINFLPTLLFTDEYFYRRLIFIDQYSHRLFFKTRTFSITNI